ncbi:MAG: hypothetical protein KAK01_00280 [Candidatus Marinimicrobia bacterium]|nr:hypothetical protein [Candidatus Neomarinimicrobiota bacterium]
MMPGLVSAETFWVRNGWQSFRNVADAHTIALGGARVTGTAGVVNVGNPALIGIKEHNRISYTHQNRFAGIINSDLLAFELPLLDRLPIGIVLLQESVNHIPNTTGLLLDWGADGLPGTRDLGENNGILDEGERLNEDQLSFFNQRQLGFQLSTAWSWKRNTFGLALKGLHHQLGKNQGNGFGIEVGIIRTLWPGAQVGLAIHDILSSWMIWDSGTVERTAPSLQVGLSQGRVWAARALSIRLYCDARLSADQSVDIQFKFGASAITLSYGMELIFKEKFQLKFGHDDIGLSSAGIGLVWEKFGFDYAYRMEPRSSQLGSSHYLTFAVDPAWLRQIGTTF